MNRFAAPFPTLPFLVLAALILAAAPGHAAPPPEAPVAKPSAADAKDLEKVQTYLKNIRTLQARFQQVAPNGQVSTGTMSLEKPGKLRFQYAPPSPLLVVADGKVITLIDYELRQVTRWPINDTPLRPLVRSDFIFGEDVEVLGIRQNEQWINVAITNPKKRDEGSMMLTFTRDPLRLTEWQVLDEKGAMTIVSLDDLRTNIALDKTLWQWKDPRPRRVGPGTK